MLKKGEPMQPIHHSTYYSYTVSNSFFILFYVHQPLVGSLLMHSGLTTRLTMLRTRLTFHILEAASLCIESWKIKNESNAAPAAPTSKSLKRPAVHLHKLSENNSGVENCLSRIGNNNGCIINRQFSPDCGNLGKRSWFRRRWQLAHT